MLVSVARRFAPRLCLVMGLAAPGALSADKPQTKIRDGSQHALQELLGEHRLRLQWIDFEDKTKNTGKAVAEMQDGLIRIKGEQRDAKGNFLTIEGDILELSPISFRMKGKIISRIEYLNQAAPCERTGEFTFATYGGRRYWRLQQLQSPCGSHVDYVDVLHRDKPKPAPSSKDKKETAARSKKKR